jgi:hypothetical protein
VHMYTFTETAAHQILNTLDTKGYQIEPGLTDEEIAAAEKAYGAPLPPDLKLLLQVGFIGNNGKLAEKTAKWPNWRQPLEEHQKAREWLQQAFTFDIKTNHYWTEQFGKKPASTEESVAQALSVMETWPPLMRLFSHRFIPTYPAEPGNPVISMWQP